MKPPTPDSLRYRINHYEALARRYAKRGLQGMVEQAERDAERCRRELALILYAQEAKPREAAR